MRLTRRVTSEWTLGAMLIAGVMGACTGADSDDGNDAVVPGVSGGPSGSTTATGTTTGTASGTVTTTPPGVDTTSTVGTTPVPPTGATTGTTTGTMGTTPVSPTGPATGTTSTQPPVGSTAAPTDSSPTSGGAPGVGSNPAASGTTPGAGGDVSTGGGGSGPAPADGPEATVRLSRENQLIQGFGINSALMPSGKSLPMDDLFGTEGANAIGMSILRVGMTPDGNLTGGFISEARSRGAKIIGSTWSPPSNCKSNGSTQNGGALLESCYDSWATTIANFAEEQDLYAMSIANESDFASCPGVPVCTDAYDTTVYTANQMVAWVKVAGAKLKEKNIKVIAPEASEWIHAWSNLSGTGSIVSSHPHSSDPLDCGCYGNEITAEAEATCAQKCLDGDGYDYGHWLWKDQAAWSSFDIFGVHEYDSQIGFAWPSDVNDGVKDKEIWQTEMSGVRHWPEEGPSTDINNGVAVAGWVHSALTVGEASAWLYWWYEAYYQNDNEGLALTQGSSTIAKRYFAVGNYSKFVRPEYIAVDMTGDIPADLLVSAYKGGDGTVVVVAINKGGAAATLPIHIDGTAPASMTPWVTSASDNLVSKDAVTVADGVFSAELPSMSITTFVGK